MANWWDFFSLSNRKNSPSDPAIGGGEGRRAIDSGTLNRVFSLLQRPGKAISTSVYNIGDDDPQTSFTQGLIDGFSGESEINWSDILEQKGVTNPVLKAVGGFAGDVAFDPLTYTGLKYAKGANLPMARARIARELEEDVVTRSPQMFEDELANRLYEIQRTDPSHLYATFAGQRITPKITVVPDAVKAAKDRMIGVEGERKLIAKALSHESENPYGLSDIKRRIDSNQASKYNDHDKELERHFGFMTDDQSKSVTIAMDNGERVGPVPIDWNGSEPIPGLNTLDDIQSLAKTVMHGYGVDEATVGQMRWDQLKENYVPRYFEPGKEPEAFPGLSRLASVRNRRFDIDEQRRAINAMPLQDLLENKGFEPEFRIDKLLRQRAASHHRKVGRGEFVLDAIRTFGIKGTPSNAGFLTKQGYQNVGDHLASDTAKNLYKDLPNEEQWFLPKEIVRSINLAEEILTDNHVGGRILQKADWFNRKFKFWNTVVSPGYHVRNLVSNTIANVSNGVTNPQYYEQAYKIMGENLQAGRAEWMNATLAKGLRQGNIDPQMAQAAGLTAPAYSDIRIGGQRVPTNVVWSRFQKEGGQTGNITSNVRRDADPEEVEAFSTHITKGLNRAADTSGNISAKMARGTALVDDWFRLAHFLSATDDAVKKGVPFQDAFVGAGDRLRKYNADYGKLSSWEKAVGRRAVPFYPWMRRNLPLQVEMLVTRPGFMAAYPKARDMLQGLMGADSGEGDQIIPEWIRNSMPVRVALGGNTENDNAITSMIRKMAGSQIGDQDAAIFLPLASSMTPMGDLTNLTNPIQKFMNAGGLQHPAEAIKEGGSELARTFFNQTTPLLKAPVELATQRSMFTGGPIPEWGPWVFGQMAPSRAGYNVSQLDEARGRSGVLSALAGINLQPVTLERQKGEAQRRRDVIEKRGLNEDSEWKAYLKELRQITGEAATERRAAPPRPRGYQRVTRTRT